MRTLNDYFITAKIEDVSTAGQIYVPVPDGGHIVEIKTALNGAIATADAVLTVKTAQGTVTPTLTIAYSGSAAGDVDSLVPTANNRVAAGETIEIETNGASTNTVSVDLVIIIRR